ncbi:MAG TPA: hypothetical protein VLR94_05225 [Acidobacteriota bacterium]|nr:hypothetical protein [Acidobacteriota bacterium]
MGFRITRREFIAGAAAAAMMPLRPKSLQAVNKPIRPKVQPFALKQVRLKTGPFLEAAERNCR